jgi:hypothetical protein
MFEIPRFVKKDFVGFLGGADDSKAEKNPP